MLYPNNKISIVKCDQSKTIIKKIENLDLSVDVFEGDWSKDSQILKLELQSD